MHKKLIVLFLLTVSLLGLAYTVRVGDTLRIEIYPENQTFTRTVKVLWDGTIPYPYLGNYPAAGKTVEQIKTDLEAHVRKYLRDFSMTVYVIEYAPMYVFIQGALNRPFDISFKPQVTLSELILRLQLSKDDPVDFSNVKVIRNGKVMNFNLLPLFYEGKLEQDIILQEGDAIHLPPLVYPQLVQVTGAYSLIERYTPDLTLRALLAKLGTLNKNTAVVESARLYIDGKVLTIDLEKVIAGLEDYKLSPGSHLYIPQREDRYAYIVGYVTNPGQKTFLPDEPMNLSTLLAKAQGIANDDKKSVESVVITLPNGEKKVFDRSILDRASDVAIEIGSIVEIKRYEEFYVYVQGFAKQTGKIFLLADEPKTLRTLLLKIGLTNEEVENEGTVFINNKESVNVKDVLFGNKDIPLNIADSVHVFYEPFRVSIVGPVGSGLKTLSYKEPRTLSYLFKSLGISEPKTIEKIVLLRDGKIFAERTPDQLIFKENDVDLNRDDTLIVHSSLANAVYVVGDYASYVTFGYNEEITLQRIFSKIGLNDYRRIEEVQINGEKLDPWSDVAVPKASLVKITLKKPIYVVVSGFVPNTGRVQFEYYEKADLINLFGKIGGLIIDPTQYYISDKVLVIRNGKVVESFDAFDLAEAKANYQLQDGDFVYVTFKEPNHVYVFGRGVPNGLFRFTHVEPFDLKNLVAKLGGIPSGVSRKIQMFNGEKFTTIEWSEDTNFQLQNGTTLIFEQDTESFVYVIDQNGSPSLIYIDPQRGTMTLYEILTKLNVDRAYRTVQLIRDLQTHEIDITDFEKTRGFVVRPGDVVKVVGVPQNLAYVLGEVNSPGVVPLTEKMTVVQALISKGGFTAKAAPNNVYLFKGGLSDPNPQKLDLTGLARGRQVAVDPILSPGDVIFVPDNPFVTALDILPVVNAILNTIITVRTVIR
ncbi:polysaccharide biosynthesis/export family protein [Pseudothermotoga thermarum]|uniref:polysaccharide biosynthesis/export family protein n=1 Tax=Pseudothermotoga thermarum TaxID=119394 RepID=UPI0002E51438|nr:polysaccharide biosynthesis/export family protein [Pseudothermotoga thermarum]